MWKLMDRCLSVFTYSAGVSVFAMMCLTTGDCIGRYLFNWPIVGAYEVTEQYLMVAGVFLGILYAYHGGAFIRVTFVVDRLPSQVKVSLNYFVQFFSIVLSLFLVIATGKQTLRIFSREETLQVFSIPLWPAYLVVVLGLFFTTIRMCLDLLRVKTGESGLFKEESHTT
jgi:TRAP-type C4-dicarboxylate transport system permease small subunit